MHRWNRFLHWLAAGFNRIENIIRQMIEKQETNQMKKNEKCYTNRKSAGTAGRTHDFCIHLPDESG